MFLQFLVTSFNFRYFYSRPHGKENGVFRIAGLEEGDGGVAAGAELGGGDVAGDGDGVEIAV